MNDTPASGPHPPRFRGVPSNEIPAVVPLRLILAETERIGAWLSGARIYSTCMTFSVEACVRESDRLLGMYGFGRPESNHTPPMLLGFEDVDGTVSTNLPGRRTGLSPSGGGGNRLHSRSGLILEPVPPAGPLHVYFAWPHFGIAETRHSLDASEFISATAEVRRLWDEVDPNTRPQFDLDDRTTPEIQIPPGGWFEAALERQKPPPRDPDAPRRINFAIRGDD